MSVNKPILYYNTVCVVIFTCVTVEEEILKICQLVSEDSKKDESITTEVSLLSSRLEK